MICTLETLSVETKGMDVTTSGVNHQLDILQKNVATITTNASKSNNMVTGYTRIIPSSRIIFGIQYTVFYTT